MRISQDVREYPDSHGVEVGVAIELGMKEKSAEFLAAGGHLYEET